MSKANDLLRKLGGVDEAKKSPLDSLEGGSSSVFADLLLFHGIKDLDDVKNILKKKKGVLSDIAFAEKVLQDVKKKVQGIG
jgi:hypothetical protein